MNDPTLTPPDHGPMPEPVDCIELLFNSLNPSHKTAAIEAVEDEIFDAIETLLDYYFAKDGLGLLNVMEDVIYKAGNTSFVQDKVEEML